MAHRLGNRLYCKRFGVQTQCWRNIRPIIARVDQICTISLIDIMIYLTTCLYNKHRIMLF